jgi:hypothetical protein
MPLDEFLTRPASSERAEALPGDGVVSPADVAMDRAFTLEAPPDVVWPWVLQLGKRRAGWYLPRTVERLVPRGRRGLRSIDPDLLSLAVGDVVPDWGGAKATFTVLELVTGSHLVYGSTRGHTRLTWCLRLTSDAANQTRMHLRLRLAPVKHPAVAERLGGLFDQLTVMGLAAGLRERVRADADTPRA